MSLSTKMLQANRILYVTNFDSCTPEIGTTPLLQSQAGSSTLFVLLLVPVILVRYSISTNFQLITENRMLSPQYYYFVNILIFYFTIFSKSGYTEKVTGSDIFGPNNPSLVSKCRRIVLQSVGYKKITL